MPEEYDKRKSDKIALTILDMLKNGKAIEKFQRNKKERGTVNVTDWNDNVAFPVSLREGVYIRKAIRKMGGNEWDWVKYVNLALLYEDGEVFGSGSE